VSYGWLAGYRPHGETEDADAARMRDLAQTETDPWLRSTPLHFTVSALIVHPETGRVLLRWHMRQQRWLQVGGHGDPGESDPLAIALREAAEESGLQDLAPWPDAALRHVVVCQVAPGKGEPAHEHADLRYFLKTSQPEAVVPENAEAPLRWLSLEAARELVGDNNVQGTLDRLESLLMDSAPAHHEHAGQRPVRLSTA
jgi:8-oxo-dGTP pyrophosphatase MutT (NUDIX family)